MIDVGLPRVVAARVTVNGLALTQRVIAVMGAAISATLVIDVQVSRGAVENLPVLLAPFVGIGMLALLLIWRATVLTALVYLLGGAILSVAVPVIGLATDPLFDEPGVYLINRIATAICLVGAVGGSALSGLLWSSLAFVVAQSSVVLGLALSGSTLDTGSGPLIVFSISAVSYLTLAIAQRQSDRKLEPLRAAGREVQGLDERRALELRAAGIVHDTVLADLTAIARSPGPVTHRMRVVLDDHLHTIDSSSVRREPASAVAASEFGDAVLGLVQDYQWSGVRVDVSGSESLDENITPEVRLAVVGAVRAALDNVVEHAATDRAELVVGLRDNQLTVLVVDDGVGFDPDSVEADRLGIRASISDRITQVGGSVRVWSGPEGTTVMMTVPVAGGES
jgi:signal transduction histidine kinase